MKGALVVLLLALTAGGILAAGSVCCPGWLLAASLGLAACALAGAAAAARRRPRAAQACLLGAAFFLGVFRHEQVVRQWQQGLARWDGQEVRVRGEVLDLAAPKPGEEQGVKLLLACSQVQSPQGEWHSAAQAVWLRLPPGQEVAWGDVFEAYGRFRLTAGFRDEGQMQRERMQAVQGIAGTLAVRQGAVRRLQSPAAEGWGLWRFRQWRQALVRRVEARLTLQEAGVLSGMLFGGYAGVEAATAQAFRDTGLVHILSVSGAHVSLLAGLLLWGSRMMGLTRRWRLAVVAGGIFLYASVAGWCAPVARAVCMGAVALGAAAWGRDKEASYALVLCAWGLLLYQPLWLWDVGFQLSFAATAGLLLLTPKAQASLAAWGLPRLLAVPLAVTWGAQMAVLPWLAHYFQQISLVSFLANLLVLPLLEGAMVLGLLLLAAGTLTGDNCWLPLWQLNGLLVEVGVRLVAWLATVPGAVAYVPPGNILAAGAYFAALWTFWRGGMPRRRQVLLWGLAVCFWLAPLAWQGRELEVHILDVGEGDALVVITPRRHVWLVDAGGAWEGGDAGSRVVLPHLRRLGVAELSGMVLTHGHADHLGGASSVLRNLPCRALLGPAMALPGKEAAALAVAPATQVRLVAPGEGLYWQEDGVEFWAFRSPGGLARGDNDESLVLWLRYKERTFFLSGDAKLETSWLPETLRCDVLKVPHHGSRSAWEEEALALLAPKYAVISVGRGNSFGHPHPATLEMLQQLGARIWRTDQDGTVRIFSDGHSLRLATTQGFGVH